MCAIFFSKNSDYIYMGMYNIKYTIVLKIIKCIVINGY